MWNGVAVRKVRSLYCIFVNNFSFSFKKALPCTLSNPCIYGTCYNNYIGGYTCTCIYGYTGTNCQYGKFLNNFLQDFILWFYLSFFFKIIQLYTVISIPQKARVIHVSRKFFMIMEFFKKFWMKKI